MSNPARLSIHSVVLFTVCLSVQGVARAQTPDAPQTAPLPSDTVTTPAPEDGSQFLAPRPIPRSSFFEGLFGGTVTDIRRLGSMQTVTWLGFGAIAAQASHYADRNVTNTLNASPAMKTTFHAGETLGGAQAQLGGAFATYVVGRVIHNDKILQTGADLFRAQLITQGITAGIKLTVRRDRPDGTQYSFPSGHTSTSFASATVLQRQFGWKVGIPAYGLATYVGLSRVQAKRHFLSDVAFGAALGILVGRTVTVGHGDGRFAVAPLATPGGAGVGFTWVGQR
jgi:membrane-associated phospholipid phosphatase